jgi:hypothetical protein
MKRARKTTKVAGMKSDARGVKKASGVLLSPKPSKSLCGAKDPDLQKGALAELQPPIPQPIKNQSRSPYTGLFSLFHDRPEFYISYGAFFLTQTIYSLKLNHRPIPAAAIEVLERAIEEITHKKTDLLVGWGISPEHARLVVESSLRAWLLDFSKRVWGCNDPDKDFLNESMRERAIIASSKHNWHRLLESIQVSFISESAECDLVNFMRRLYGVVKENKTGFEAHKINPADWARKLVTLWAVIPDQSYVDPEGKLLGKIPPVCLWSGPAINTYFNLGLSDNAVNQAICRMGLFWPNKTLRFGIEETTERKKKTLRFTR